MKTLRNVLLSIGIIYLVACLALLAVMLESTNRFAAVMKHIPWRAMAILPFRPLWNVARGGHFAIGDPAQDFTLESVDHTGSFRLSSLRGKQPAVLVFGSYT
jgi:hypothetical protein